MNYASYGDPYTFEGNRNELIPSFFSSKKIHQFGIVGESMQGKIYFKQPLEKSKASLQNRTDEYK